MGVGSILTGRGRRYFRGEGWASPPSFRIQYKLPQCLTSLSGFAPFRGVCTIQSTSYGSSKDGKRCSQ